MTNCKDLYNAVIAMCLQTHCRKNGDPLPPYPLYKRPCCLMNRIARDMILRGDY